MTLSTLKTMNLPMADLTESLRIKPAQEAAARTEAPAPARKASASKAAPAVDPMQWWGALTNQFAELATTAMKDSAADAAKFLAGGMMKHSFDAATETMKKVAGAPGRAVAGAAKSVGLKAGRRAIGARQAARQAAPRRAGRGLNGSPVNAPLPQAAARSVNDRARRQAEVVARARGRRAGARPALAVAKTPCPTSATA